MLNESWDCPGHQLPASPGPSAGRRVQLSNLDKRQFTPHLKERGPLPENRWKNAVQSPTYSPKPEAPFNTSDRRSRDQIACAPW